MRITAQREDGEYKFFKGNTYVAWLGADGEFRKILRQGSIYIGMNYTVEDAKRYLNKEISQ